MSSMNELYKITMNELYKRTMCLSCNGKGTIIVSGYDCWGGRDDTEKKCPDCYQGFIYSKTNERSCEPVTENMENLKVEKATITLNAEEHLYLCSENILVINDVDIAIEEIICIHNSQGRHQDFYTKIFKTLHDGKFYAVDYSTSYKDEMGWHECNISKTYVATEVFPKQVITTVYK